MRGKLRAGGAAVGFFAFQDIITSVIGIVIFIALLLSLFIGTEADVNRSKRIAEQASPEQLQELETLLNRLQSLQSELSSVLSLPIGNPISDAQLREFLDILVAQLENIRQSTINTQEGPTQIELDIQSLEKMLQEREKRRKQIQSDLAAAQNKTQDLQDRIQDIQNAILEEEKLRNDLWIIPDKAITTKRPFLIIAGPEEFELKSIDGRIQKSGENLQELLQGVSPLEHYLVFYLKPSAFTRWPGIFKAAKQLNFEVGYEPIREDQNILLGEPKS
jgi:organic radical activating enzyme